MPLYFGQDKVGSLYLGSTKIGEAYFGSTKVYESGESMLPAKTMRFQFSNTSFDPRTDTAPYSSEYDVYTWSKVDEGIYDFTCNLTNWSFTSGSTTRVPIFNFIRTAAGSSTKVFDVTTYAGRVDILDSNLTGVTDLGTFCQAFVASMRDVRLRGCQDLTTCRQWGGGSQRNQCTSFSIDNMSSVTSTYMMFNKFPRLTSVVIPPTPLCTDMHQMFGTCAALTSVHVKDASAATTLLDFCNACSALTSVRVDNLSQPCTMKTAFKGCSSLVNFPVMDLSQATNTSSMFQNCTSLASVSNVDASNATDVSSMFKGCTSLTAVSIDIASATTTASMLQGCSSLSSVTVQTSSTLTNTSSMFYGCSALTTVPQFNTSSCQNMQAMFRNCTSLTTQPSLDYSVATDLSYLFAGCTSLTAVSIDIASATTTANMFNGCSSLSSVTVQTSSTLTNTSSMFYGCSALTTVPSVTLPAATNTSYMFKNCTSVASGTLSMYNYLSTKSVAVTTKDNTFQGCGSGTVTGNAELATIPAVWGGYYIVSGNIGCTRVPISTNPSVYEAWTCANTQPYRTMPYWTDSGPEIDISTATDPVPSDYSGIGMRRDRIFYSVNNMDLTATADLYIRPAFFQNTGSSVETPFNWILTTSTALGHLPGGTTSSDMPKTFSAATVGSTDVHYGTYDSTKSISFGFVATNASPSNWQGLTDAYGLLVNYGFVNFTIDWSLTQ